MVYIQTFTSCEIIGFSVLCSPHKLLTVALTFLNKHYDLLIVGSCICSLSSIHLSSELEQANTIKFWKSYSVSVSVVVRQRFSRGYCLTGLTKNIWTLWMPLKHLEVGVVTGNFPISMCFLCLKTSKRVYHSRFKKHMIIQRLNPQLTITMHPYLNLTTFPISGYLLSANPRGLQGTGNH